MKLVLVRTHNDAWLRKYDSETIDLIRDDVEHHRRVGPENEEISVETAILYDAVMGLGDKAHAEFV